MKNVYLLLIFALIPIFSFAELQIKIGNDTTFCDFFETKLGTNMIIEGGTPPYTYRWTTQIILYGNTYYAGTFLDDPALKTPTFKDRWSGQKWEPFVLEVTDANNIVARDTINVRFSEFVYLLGYTVLYQNIGDEIELFGGGIFGGILPYRSYSWSPADDLLTPHSQNTICRVTQFARYFFTVEDSVGCQASNLVYEIWVQPTTDVSVLKSKKSQPYLNNKTLYWENSWNLPVKLEIYDMKGRKIKRADVVGNEYSFRESDVPLQGIYVIWIGTHKYSGKY